MNIEQKSAFIVILGRANVGKSSLINKIVGQKIAIVSDKPQTTRTRIMGVHTNNESQLVFVDTPGFHKPHNLLGEQMIKAVGTGMSDVEAAVLVVDASPKFKKNCMELPPAEIALINELTVRKLKTILVINKIDLLDKKEDILDIIVKYKDAFDFDAIIPVSAVKGDGIQTLINECFKYCVPSAHYFAQDDITDQPDEIMICELIREKMFRLLQKEIPHGVAVCIDRFFEKDTNTGEPILNVEATIFCEKESHKGIIIGKSGATLKKIGTSARIDIEKFYGIRASLKLWVKVKEDWRNRQGIIHSFGLD